MCRLASIIFSVGIMLSGCQQKEVVPTKTDNLSTLKDEFLQQICTKSAIEEGPFSFNYRFRTIFFSENLISLFGELTVQDRLPHGWKQYEGKTLCKIEGQWKEITLDDLFQTKEQKEFLRTICEVGLKKNLMSHFSGNEPLYTVLKYENVHTFVVDDKNIIVIFQPYSVGGVYDEPFIVKIPLDQLKGHLDNAYPLFSLIDKATKSYECISSWDTNMFYENL